MIILRQQLYSLESGGPDKPGSLLRELGNKARAGAIVGGVLGAGTTAVAALNSALAGGNVKEMTKIGAVATGILASTGAIIGGLMSLGAEGRLERAAGVSMDRIIDKAIASSRRGNSQDYTNVITERYIVENGDPNKFPITMAMKDGQGIIVLNKPDEELIEYLDDELEQMVRFNRKADYTSVKSKTGYEIYLTCPNIDTMSGIIFDLVSDLEIKINCITDKTVNKFLSNIKK